MAALLAGCTQPAGNGDDQSLADEASTLSVGREDSGSSGNVVKDGWRLLCESSGEGLRALEIEEQRFACWAAHDATVQAVAGYTPSTSLVAAHTDMLVHLAAAAACWKRTSLATGSTRATITWLCGLAASVQRWSVRMQSAPVWLAGWADSPTLLSVAQWARDEALWIVHALHQWRGEGAGGAVQQALLDVEEVVSKALHAVRAVVAPQVRGGGTCLHLKLFKRTSCMSRHYDVVVRVCLSLHCVAAGRCGGGGGRAPVGAAVRLGVAWPQPGVAAHPGCAAGAGGQSARRAAGHSGAA